MATALKTGDVKKVSTEKVGIFQTDTWGYFMENGLFIGSGSREKARYHRNENGGTRIAKILKITPKTVTVEISK